MHEGRCPSLLRFPPRNFRQLTRLLNLVLLMDLPRYGLFAATCIHERMFPFIRVCSHIVFPEYCRQPIERCQADERKYSDTCCMGPDLSIAPCRARLWRFYRLACLKLRNTGFIVVLLSPESNKTQEQLRHAVNLRRCIEVVTNSFPSLFTRSTAPPFAETHTAYARGCR